MISPELPLAAVVVTGCAHMLYTDARSFEINPWTAFTTGAAAIYYGASFGPEALISSLGGAAALTVSVATIRHVRSAALGLGDYALLATCGTMVGIDALLPFLIIFGAFGIAASVIMGRLRPRKRRWSAYPLATAAIPAAMIATVARYQYGATFSKPFSWVLS